MHAKDCVINPQLRLRLVIHYRNIVNKSLEYIIAVLWKFYGEPSRN